MSTLENIIRQALSIPLDKRYSEEIKTTVVALHLAQMQEWGVRGGSIQIKPVQDTDNIRDRFISELSASNNLSQRLDTVMASLCCRGEVLWLLRESKSNENDSGYELDFYVGGANNPNPEYWVFYELVDGIEQIECVVVKEWRERNHSAYSPDMPIITTLGGTNDVFVPLKEWSLTFYSRAEIKKFQFFQQEPSRLNSYYYLYKNSGGAVMEPDVAPNPFAPRLPFVLCKNKWQRDKSKPGVDDFSPIESLIAEHNELLLNASDNLVIFNTSTLVTSRDADSVVEAVSGREQDNTWAGLNGYRGIQTQGRGRHKPGYRMPRVIGGVRDGERFGYIQSPDAISGDHNLYIRQIRELIHWTLGGIDPLGISASATFGEIKSLFGRIENTALKKIDALLGKKGLCNLYSMAIAREEEKAKVALTNFLIARLNTTPEAISAIKLDDATFRELYFYCTDELGLEIPGLPPLGNRDCTWRHTRDVYQRTTREMLDASIVYRNEREDGISQQVALSKLYPGMRDDEIRAMMSGFSPRVVESALGGIAGVLNLYSQLMQVPDPETGMPMAVKLGIAELIEQGVITLRKELTYNVPNFRESRADGNINQILQTILDNVQSKSNSISTTTIPSASPRRNTQAGRPSR